MLCIGVKLFVMLGDSNMVAIILEQALDIMKNFWKTSGNFIEHDNIREM